ncbi:hypothetical protein GCM10023175_60800 [Pseudonocardia xishanensis]|uniref:Tetracyclin repressor-like C-terminal domain-containing protein n=1 Tax=Pseudonocardia xishanensis TaxID=630995 RepID=A0ABP8S206_9PSEU
MTRRACARSTTYRGASGGDRGAFDGPLSRWRDDVLTVVVEHGMNAGAGEDHDRQLTVFAEELVPLVREALATI